jgi:hypothetical protein
MVSPHMVAMLNELDNLLGLDTILNGKSIGLKTMLVNYVIVLLRKIIIEGNRS